MFRFSKLAGILTALLLSLMWVAPAQAQATRTWVSGVGDDANPCSRTAPCKTWAGAISKTAAGGEIDALDPGGFGAVTITKNMTLDGGGTLASILNSLTTGIIVNAANVVVTIRNLSLNGAGTGINGISFLQGLELNVENCVIFGNTQAGINFAPSNVGARLFVRNTTIHDNTQNGILAKPPNTSNLSGVLAIDHSQLSGNGQAGLAAQGGALVTSHDSSYVGNGTGVLASLTATFRTRIHLNNDMVSENSTGVKTVGSGVTTIDISDVGIYGNSVNGIDVSGGGVVSSFGNNHIDDNNGTQAPNSSIPPVRPNRSSGDSWLTTTIRAKAKISAAI